MSTLHQPNLQGKTVVITGGSGVIGSAFARALASLQAQVVILNRTESTAKQLAQSIREEGGQAIGIACDVTDYASVEHAKEEILKTHSSIDVLINAAGGNHKSATVDTEFFNSSDLKSDVRTFFDLDLAGIRGVFDLNLMGTIIPTHVFAKDMTEGSSIVNISSMTAFTPLTKIPAYGAAKASINNVTQWLAVYLSKVNIRVNAIAPGFFLTKQNYSMLKDSNDNWTARADKILTNTPMGRFGTPDELIGALLFLIDNEASGFVTGIVLPVDGGFQAYSGV